jgi:hypothetical protein
MTTNPRRRDPAINSALRTLGLPPLLTGDYDEDAEPMSQRKAVLIVAGYTALYAPMLMSFVEWSLHGAHKF